MAPLTPSSEPNDNIFGSEAEVSVPVAVRPEFGGTADEFELVSKLAKERKDDAEAYSNLLGQINSQMQPLIQMSKDDLQLQEQLVRVRKEVAELTERGTAAARSQREEYEKLIELAQTMARISGDNGGIPSIDYTSATRINNPHYGNIEQQLISAFHGPGSTNPIGGPSVGPHFSRAQRDIQGGNLGRGMSEVQDVIREINEANLDLTREQIEAVRLLTQYYDDLRETAIDAATMADEASEAAGIDPADRGPRRTGRDRRGPRSGPRTADIPARNSKGSFYHNILSRADPAIFGKAASEKEMSPEQKASVQKIMGSVPGGLGRMLQGSKLASGIGGEALAGLGNALPPLAAAAAVAGTAGNAWVGLEKNRRQWMQSYGAMDMSDTAHYEMQARVMAISPFLSDDQARKIIQDSFRQGFHGETADNAIDFAVKNFQRFGMESAKSMEIFKTNSVLANESTTQVASSLERLSNIASRSSASMEQLQQNYQQNSATAVGYGAEQGTSQFSSEVSGFFAGDPMTSGMNFGDLLNNDRFKARMSRYMGVSVRHFDKAFSDILSKDPRQATDLMIRVVQEQMPNQFKDPQWLEANGPIVKRWLDGRYPGIAKTDAQAVAFIKSMIKGPETIQAQRQGSIDELKPQHQEGNWFSDTFGNPVTWGGQVLGNVGSWFGNEIGGGNSDTKTKNDIDNLYNQWIDEKDTKLPIFEKFLRNGPNMNQVVIKDKDGTVYNMSSFTQKYGKEAITMLANGEAQIMDSHTATFADGKFVDPKFDSSGMAKKGSNIEKALSEHGKWSTMTDFEGIAPGYTQAVREGKASFTDVVGPDGKKLTQIGGGEGAMGQGSLMITVQPPYDKAFSVIGQPSGEFSHNQQTEEQRLHGEGNRNEKR